MTVDPIERMNLTLAASAVAASVVWASPVFALSLAAGAALEAFNFRGTAKPTITPDGTRVADAGS